jgi:hypothetical protein
VTPRSEGEKSKRILEEIIGEIFPNVSNQMNFKEDKLEMTNTKFHYNQILEQ